MAAGFAAVAPAILALDPKEPKMLGLGDAPNRLVVVGLSGILNGFDVVAELPKRLVLSPGLGLGLISFSFSLSASGNSLDGEPKGPPLKRDGTSLGAVDFVIKGETDELNKPNTDVGFGGESVEGLDDDDDDEKKSGTFVVEPKADFAGLEDAVGVVIA
jgi:hypothetical protein